SRTWTRTSSRPRKPRSQATWSRCPVPDFRSTLPLMILLASNPPGVAFPVVLPRRGELPVEVTTSERYASGAAAPELPAQNLVKACYAVVDRLGDDLAIRDEARDKEISWSELRELVHRIAGGLAKLGLGKDDTVAIMLGNRWEFIPCDLAAVSLGATPF